jgi:hypothetical protein
MELGIGPSRAYGIAGSLTAVVSRDVGNYEGGVSVE